MCMPEANKTCYVKSSHEVPGCQILWTILLMGLHMKINVNPKLGKGINKSRAKIVAFKLMLGMKNNHKTCSKPTEYAKTLDLPQLSKGLKFHVSSHLPLCLALAILSLSLLCCVIAQVGAAPGTWVLGMRIHVEQDPHLPAAKQSQACHRAAV